MNKIDFKHLSYFLETARASNMVKAARRHGISQPSITHGVGVLEEYLGRSLFRRADHGLQLTASGTRFQASAVALSRTLSEGFERTRAIHREEQGQLRVGTSVDGIVYSLSACVARAREAGIGEVTALDLPAGMGIDTTRSMALDLAVVGERLRPEDYETLESEVIVSSTVSAYLPANHALARSGSLTLAELARLPIVLLDARSYPGHLDDIEQNFRRHHLSSRIVQTPASERTLLNYARTGVGVAIVVGASAAGEHAGLSRVSVPDLAINVPRRLEIIWRRDRLYPVLTRFRTLLAERLRR